MFKGIAELDMHPGLQIHFYDAATLLQLYGILCDYLKYGCFYLCDVIEPCLLVASVAQKRSCALSNHNAPSFAHTTMKKYYYAGEAKTSGGRKCTSSISGR